MKHLGRCLLLLVAAPLVAGPSSASFHLVQSTANGGGAPTSSGSFVLNGSLGQEGTIGTSSSPHFVVQSGFWSFQGSSLVPVVLFAAKNGSNGDDVDLLWTGNNSPYDLYAATDCTALYGSYLTTVAGQTFTDSPPAANLTCYGVVATAPGPFAPPLAGKSSDHRPEPPPLPRPERPALDPRGYRPAPAQVEDRGRPARSRP